MVTVEFIVQFVIYCVICHGCVGLMKHLLLVGDDWREPVGIPWKELDWAGNSSNGTSRPQSLDSVI